MKRVYKIGGMDCASCALTIQKAVSKTPGVEKAEVNYVQAKMVVEGDANPEEVAAKVAALGYKVTGISSA